MNEKSIPTRSSKLKIHSDMSIRRNSLENKGAYRLWVGAGLARPATLVATCRIVLTGFVWSYFLGQDYGLGEVRRETAADEKARAGPRLGRVRLQGTVGQYFNRLMADRARRALDCEHIERPAVEGFGRPPVGKQLGEMR